MTPLPAPILDRFMSFLHGHCTIEEFERWVYENVEALEDALSLEDYLTLLSLDYSRRVTIQEITTLMQRYFEPGDHETREMKRVLRGILQQGPDTAELIESCYYYYGEGYRFLDILGLNYGQTIFPRPGSRGRTQSRRCYRTFCTKRRRCWIGSIRESLS